MTRPPLRGVVFDCDGVLADSEGTANLVIAEDLSSRGWTMTPEEARSMFGARAFTDIEQMAIERLGSLPAEWRQRLVGQMNDAFGKALEPILGGPEALRAIQGLGLKVAIASNSSRSELRVKLKALALADMLDARLAVSFEDVARPKPAPDVYLEAARRLGVAPAEIAVIEDTAVGARAGIAAGMRVLGFAPTEADRAALVTVGAEPFAAMADLPARVAQLARLEGAAA